MVSIFSDYILVIAAFIWLVAAAVQDIKKREVANWLSFSLALVALAIRGFSAVINKDFMYFIYGVIGLVLFFAIANAFYYGRIFAGGDAKLLAAVGVIFIIKPSFVPIISSNTSLLLPLPFFLTFIINILFVGSVYGIIYSLVLAFRNYKIFGKEIKKLEKKTKKLRFLFLGFSALFLIAFILLKQVNFLLLVILTLIFPYLFIFIRAVESSCMIKMIKTSKLTEGDWLAERVKIGRHIIIPKWEGLNNKEIALLKKKKEVLIKEGLPFVPVFLLAAIASLFGNLIAILIGFLS